MNSILITNSGINKNSGGGVVSYNLMEALHESTDLKYIHCNQTVPDKKINETLVYSINPADYGYVFKPDKNYFYWPTPFFQDYLSFHLLRKDLPVDLAVTYGCPFGLTVEEIKREFKSKIVCDLAPHIIEISREEHLKSGTGYPYPHLTNEDMWGLYSRHLRLADAVIVHSGKSAEYIKEKARLSQLPAVIPHGHYQPTTIGGYPEKFTPGYFGAMGADKGVIYLANAWINHKSDLQLLVGGAESQSLKVKDEFKHRFKMIGAVENISDFYNNISIYIQPSVSEGFGITALEAMAHARPVIVSEGAGVSELVTVGKDGFTFPIRDTKSITAHIQFFIDNPEQIKKMGMEAKKTSEKYTWAKINERYKEFFKKLSPNASQPKEVPTEIVKPPEKKVEKQETGLEIT